MCVGRRSGVGSPEVWPQTGGGQDPETEQMVLVPLCSKGPEGRGLYLLITFKAL